MYNFTYISSTSITNPWPVTCWRTWRWRQMTGEFYRTIFRQSDIYIRLWRNTPLTKGLSHWLVYCSWDPSSRTLMEVTMVVNGNKASILITWQTDIEIKYCKYHDSSPTIKVTNQQKLIKGYGIHAMLGYPDLYQACPDTCYSSR